MISWTQIRQTRWVYMRDLLYELVVRDMKLRYKGSLLGFVWSLLNPVLQLLVFSLVFRFLLPLDIPNYTAFLFCGLLAWNWFQSSLYAASTAIVNGRQLIKRPGFPISVLPIVTISSDLVHFLLALPVLLLFLPFTGIVPTTTILFLPVLVIIQFLLTASLGYFLATFHVFYRDTQYLVGVALLLFFYLTPIFYDASFVPERWLIIYRLNPMVHLVEGYRAIFMEGQFPPLLPLLVITLVSVVLLLIGYRVFMQASYTFVEEL